MDLRRVLLAPLCCLWGGVVMAGVVRSEGVLGFPVFVHTVSEDGLSMVSTATTDGGVYTATVGWADVETAQAHYGVARDMFEAKHGALTIEVGERRWIRVFRLWVGEVTVAASAGPPTWWRPRAGVGRASVKSRSGWRVRGGWLRFAVEVYFTRR